jgi:hypothetical protein
MRRSCGAWEVRAVAEREASRAQLHDSLGDCEIAAAPALTSRRRANGAATGPFSPTSWEREERVALLVG